MADPAENGWPAEKVFDGAQNGFAYDDIIFMPGHVSFEASAADVSSQLTRNIRLSTPILGSPVDTVTEAEMAIALALAGGMGIIHCNQSVAAQVEMLKRVKRHVNGFILEPFVMGPKNTLADLDKLKAAHGVGSVPVTEDGKLRGALLGWVGARDAETVSDRTRQLQQVMVRKVVTGREPLSLEEATAMLRRSKVGKLPIVDGENRLVSLVTRSDLKKVRDFPRMSRSLDGHLLAGAAVAANGRDDWERAQALAGAGADVIFVDVVDSSGDRQLELLRRLKADWPQAELLAGPAASCREAKRLVEAGADGIVVGGAVPPGGDALGAVAAVGRPEATAIYEVARYVRLNYQCPTIAGPAIRDVGQLLKALCLGASAVMLSEPLAGADEAPGLQVLQNGTFMKLHHSAEPVLTVCQTLAPGFYSPPVMPHNISHLVTCKGSAVSLVHYLMQGVRYGMQDLGIRSVRELHVALDSGELRLECRSAFATRSWAAGMQLLQAEVAPLFVAA